MLGATSIGKTLWGSLEARYLGAGAVALALSLMVLMLLLPSSCAPVHSGVDPLRHWRFRASAMTVVALDVIL